MNSDTVNPIPPRAATAPSDGHVISSGRRPSPLRTARDVASVMPTTFPTTSPSTTPAATARAPGAAKESDRIGTPALARAKTGSTTKLVHGWSRCSRRSAGDTGDGRMHAGRPRRQPHADAQDDVGRDPHDSYPPEHHHGGDDPDRGGQ